MDNKLAPFAPGSRHHSRTGSGGSNRASRDADLALMKAENDAHRAIDALARQVKAGKVLSKQERQALLHAQSMLTLLSVDLRTNQ